MDDTVLMKKVKSLKDLDCEPAYQVQRKAYEVGLFDKFIEVFV